VGPGIARPHATAVGRETRAMCPLTPHGDQFPGTVTKGSA
jgi:hypothetical protein